MSRFHAESGLLGSRNVRPKITNKTIASLNFVDPATQQKSISFVIKAGHARRII